MVGKGHCLVNPGNDVHHLLYSDREIRIKLGINCHAGIGALYA